MKKEGTFIEALSAILVKHHVFAKKEEAALIKAFKDSSADYFEEFLIDEGLVDDINIIRALGEYYQVPTTDVVGHFFDHSLLHMFPKDFLLRNGIIPLEVDEDSMIVVAANPADQDLLPALGEYVSYDIRFTVGLRRHICDAAKEFYDEALTQEVRDLDIEEKLRQKNEALQLKRDGKLDVYDEESE